jgi:Tol biopolymer transport system component
MLRVNLMKFPAKFNPLFDRFLLGGLGCGFIALCFVISAFFYIWQNPPRTGLTRTPLVFEGAPTVTPGPTATPLFQFATPSALPTGLPALSPTAAQISPTPGSLAPSPIPQSEYANTVPKGKIVFTCFINQIDQICLMNADGSGRKQLTDFEETSFYPSLSPDGDTIYFSSRQTGSFDIYSMNLRGRGLRRLTGGLGALYAPERSSMDDRIVFANSSDNRQLIWIMRTDGKNPHAVSSGPDDIDPTYSPNGLMIAFASARTGRRQLYVMDRDGSEVRQITDLPDMGGRSTWSPDGRRLAFYAGPPENHNIYVINVDGTGLVQLTNGGDNLGPSWSPDGNWIAFTSFRDGNNEIYIMHPDGTGVTRLTNNTTSDWQPRWGP